MASADVSGGVDAARESGAKPGLPRPVLLLLLLAATAFLTIYTQQPPPASPATAPPDDFSPERALRHVRAVAQRPRPVGEGRGRGAQL